MAQSLKTFWSKERRLIMSENRLKKSMTICVAAPEKGQYAVVVYHDENGNHKFDRNWIGFPT
jgi:uncharacterized protein (DUF2141 family)